MFQTPLETFLELAEKSAEKPFYLLPKDEQDELVDQVKGVLQSIKENLDPKTDVYKVFDDFEKDLDEAKSKEDQIAKAMVYITDMYSDEKDPEIVEMIKELNRYTKTFQERAKIFAIHKKLRDSLKASCSPEELIEKDKETFDFEGMKYSLEYYLAIYQQMQIAETEEKKRAWLESDKINFGFGDLPGLKSDFEVDEVLEKFIYKVLDDEIREKLVVSYYRFKDKINKIIKVTDEKGNVFFEYQITLDDFMQAYKTFLVELINIFKEVGITNLSSEYFKPYGKGPTLDEVIEKL